MTSISFILLLSFIAIPWFTFYHQNFNTLGSVKYITKFERRLLPRINDTSSNLVGGASLFMLCAVYLAVEE